VVGDSGRDDVDVGLSGEMTTKTCEYDANQENNRELQASNKGLVGAVSQNWLRGRCWEGWICLNWFATKGGRGGEESKGSG
jgi:hypothetical protein